MGNIKNVLLDTNVIIHLEDNKIIRDDLSDLIRIGKKNEVHFYYHEKCLNKDISRDTDEVRKKIILSKLKTYEPLDEPLEISEGFKVSVPSKNINDEIDNEQLYQLYRGRVDLLITEDVDLRKKGRIFSLEDRVLNIGEASAILNSSYRTYTPEHPSLKSGSVGKIEKYLGTPFFDGLRNDYSNFDKWFMKCVAENRKCYYLEDGGMLGALAIYNVEEPKAHGLRDVPEKVIKICTFKVGTSMHGFRVGQAMLQNILSLCVENGYKHAYMTIEKDSKTELTELKDLLETFGFEKSEPIDRTKYPNREFFLKITEKQLIPRVDAQGNTAKIHPFYTDQNRKKWIIPIQPTWFNILFKNSRSRLAQLFDPLPVNTEEAEGNSILKSYITTNLKSYGLKRGDIALFYVSKHASYKLVEPIGIIEEVQIIDDLAKLLESTRKRTVYERENLENLLAQKGKVMVYQFRYIGSTSKPIRYSRLRTLKAAKTKFVAITNLKDVEYNELKEEGYFDKRYLID